MARNPNRETIFRFQQFNVVNNRSAMKVGTDGVLLGATAAVPTDLSRPLILDIGTGTGLIALIMAQRFESAELTAIEIDPEAASEADINISASKFASRINLICDDILTANFDIKFDAIVCNPPFFTETLQAPVASRATARHEKALSMEALFTKAAQLLTDNGLISIIYPSTRDDEVKLNASLAKLHINKMINIITKEGKEPTRTIWTLSLCPTESQRFTLILHDTSGNPTTEYINIVKPFYITVK